MPTKRSNGEGTIRQRPDGRWEARYTAGVNPGTGKQIRKSIYGDTQQEVAKKLRAVTTSIDDGVYTEPSKMTVGQWLDIWHRDYLGSVKPHTVSQYETQIRVNLKPKLGAVLLASLNAHTIQGMYNDAVKPKKDKPGLSPKSVRNLHGVLHKALQQAVMLGYIRHNPTNACKLPRVEKKEMHPLMDEDVGRFINAIKGHKFESLFLVDLFTGMRQGELIGLTWDCVDFKGGTITVNKQLQKERGKGGQYRFVPLKNDKERRFAPATFVMERLQERRQWQITQKLRAGEAWGNAMNLVFTNELGHFLPPGTVYGNFKRVVTKLGLEVTRFHDLRHSYAMLSLQNGDDVKTVQETMGHHTAAFTLDQYGHVSEKMKRESAARMDAYIQGMKPGK